MRENILLTIFLCSTTMKLERTWHRLPKISQLNDGHHRVLDCEGRIAFKNNCSYI
jgi:hypothetical protein